MTSKVSLTGKAGRVRGILSLALSIFRPSREARPAEVKSGVAAARKAAAQAAPIPRCRPLNAAEMNEVERLSSMRAALYPKD